LAQLAAAVVLAAIAWPFAAAELASLDGLALESALAPTLADAQTLLAGVLQPMTAVELAWAEAQPWLARLAAEVELASSLAGLPLLETLLGAAIAALVWAIGTALLIRQPFPHLLRRRP
jgi:hypothetical protein